MHFESNFSQRHSKKQIQLIQRIERIIHSDTSKTIPIQKRTNQSNQMLESSTTFSNTFFQDYLETPKKRFKLDLEPIMRPYHPADQCVIPNSRNQISSLDQSMKVNSFRFDQATLSNSKSLGKRNYLSFVGTSNSSEVVSKKSSSLDRELNFKIDDVKVVRYMESLSANRLMDLFQKICCMPPVKELLNEQIQRSQAFKEIIKTKEANSIDEPHSNQISPKCESKFLFRIFKHMQDIKCNLYDIRTQTEDLLKILKRHISSEQQVSSGKLILFIIAFLSGRSEATHYAQLTNLEKLLFFSILIKKQYNFNGIKCLCFSSIKVLEGNGTRKRTDELIKFYITKLFKVLARRWFPQLKREKDQLKRFYKETFNFDGTSTTNIFQSTWYKNQSVFNVNSSQKKDCLKRARPCSIRQFLCHMKSLPNLNYIFSERNSKNLSEQIEKQYLDTDIPTKLTRIIKSFNFSNLNERLVFSIDKFADSLTRVLTNSKTKLCFSVFEIRRAAAIIFDLEKQN